MKGVVALAALLVSIAPGAPAEWGRPGNIVAIDSGITPGVAVDDRGGIHLVYMRGSEIYYRAGRHVAGMGAPERVPAPRGPGEYNSPHLVCDPAGTVHVVFTRDFTRHAQIAWYANRQAGRWSTPVVAIDQTGTERRVNYPRLAVDGTTAYVGAFAVDGSIVAKLVDITTTARVAGRLESRLWVAHPFVRGGELLLVGRAGAQGHMLGHHSRDLAPAGAPLLLSRGTPGKTGEPTAVCMDRHGVVHVAGVTGGAPEYLWYSNDRRAAAGENAALGPVVGEHVREFTFPVLQEDRRGRLYLAYRDHATGEGRITVIDSPTARFAGPVVFAPAITRRLRWNAPLAAAPGGGVYAVWEYDGRVFLRSIGLP